MSKSLTKAQQSRLEQQEAIIERGKLTFVEVGTALAIVRDEGLYPQRSFEVYCEERWGFGPDYARKIIRAAATVEELRSETNVSLPSTESQARAISEVEPERRAEVWQEAVSRAPVDEKGKPKVTASLIREVAEEIEEPAPADTRLVRAREADRRFDEVKRLFRQLKNEITAIREEGFLPHVTNGLELGLDACRNQISDGIPFSSCPHCDGKCCEKCRGRGWLCKMEHGQLSKRDLAKAVEL